MAVFTHSTITIMFHTFGIKQFYAHLNHTCTILTGHDCQTKSNPVGYPEGAAENGSRHCLIRLN